MPTKSRIWMVLACVLGCLLLFSPEAQPTGEQQVGRILDSHATSLRGVAVPKSETILSGDVLATSDDGSALVELKSGAKLKITKSSSVRFLGDGDKVQAELLAGAVVSESAGKPTLAVTTSKYRFAPSQEGNCRYAVALSKQQETLAAAMKGDLLVRANNSGSGYLLREGKYAVIPASSVGVPSQEKAGGEPTSAGQVGTVTNLIPEEVLQRRGRGEEIPLKVNDGVNQEDVIRTFKKGRVRITLLDGSFLNVAPRSVLRIIKQDAQTQQTQLELTLGLLRAEGVRLAEPGASFKVQTPTATISMVGTVLFVHALPNLTQVYCVQGVCSVQNSNPAIAKQVTLHTGEFTNVSRGLPPSAPVETSAAKLQSEVNQTNVGPPTTAVSGPGGWGGGATTEPWHIGSLSPTSSLLLVIGVGAGAAAAAIPLAASGGGAAPPASPSVP